MFTAFALVSTLALAGGGLLLLIGYIGTLPAAFSQGLRVGLPVLLLPLIGPCGLLIVRARNSGVKSSSWLPAVCSFCSPPV